MVYDLDYEEDLKSGGDCLHDIQIQQWRSGSTAENVPIYTVQMVNEGSKGVEQIMVDCRLQPRSALGVVRSIMRGNVKALEIMRASVWNRARAKMMIHGVE
ncbi:hypothetical protein QJS10_CPB12g01610 [Acorus calamus]|uniref:Uncharacterized protein n=1 Tax=Acorus calamus TaxID=4465 RepID=A0AAV9DPS9_ACOCL|nr:hypothetical protein QJS10_CPB12g01610 [Acorus calamus]